MFGVPVEAWLVIGLFSFVVVCFLARTAVKPGGFLDKKWQGKE